MGLIRKIFNREFLLYLVFGVLTTLVSIAAYYLLGTVLGLHYLVANLLSWVAAVLFAYFTNRRWVFATRAAGKAQLREFSLFIAARLFSLAVEEAGLWLLVDVLLADANAAKLITQVVVVVLNYVFGKLVVFKK
ncbi:MAG: GtrA family protein [Christensenellaceae bacterium]|nr:GtrA family protein [Christensenellaceae bacterium]